MPLSTEGFMQKRLTNSRSLSPFDTVSPDAIIPPRNHIPSHAIGGTALEKEILDDRVKRLAALALEKLAENLVVLRVGDFCSYADYIIICTGKSDRQVQGICSNIEHKMKLGGEKPLGVEGYEQGHWALLDYGDVIIHVFYEPVRSYYDIEGLWPEVPKKRVEG